MKRLEHLELAKQIDDKFIETLLAFINELMAHNNRLKNQLQECWDLERKRILGEINPDSLDDYKMKSEE